MYVRREAVLSSQIEGTQSSLDDVLAYELDPGDDRLPHDVEEIVHYVRAMNYGLERLSSLPLSLRLLREIHAELMASGRGADKEPGEFRRTQNGIGGAGATLAQAAFVPPPPHEILQALGDLEGFLHRPRRPEGWLAFFLRGVAETAEEATGTAQAIVALRERQRDLLLAHGLGVHAVRALDLLFVRPLVNVNLVTRELDVNYATANKLVEQLQGLDILTEITGGRRNRVFRHTPYLRLFSDADPSE